MDNGWIKLHRKILDNPIASKPNYLSLWIHLLIMANHEEERGLIWEGKMIKQKAGEFITGRKTLSERTGIPETTIERILDLFEKEGQIGQQKTTKYRVITILKWKDYQNSDSKRTTDGQQTDTIKNTKKDKKYIAEQAPQDDIVKIIDSFKPVNGAFGRWYGNTTQRGAISRMIETHGLEQVLKVVAILPKTNTMPWITTITTPSQLEDKWSTLEAQLKKEKAKLQVKNKSTPNYVL